MDFLTSMQIGASGLTAQRKRMDTIASNLANIETTRTPEGGPYKRRDVMFAALPLDDFAKTLNDALADQVRRVAASRRRYKRGSWDVIPLGQSPILQMLQRSDSDPRQPAAACITYFPICTPLAPSMMRAAALAARLPLLPIPPPAKRGTWFCIPSFTRFR